MENNIQEKIVRFNELQQEILDGLEPDNAELEEMNRLAEEFLEITKNTYNNIANKYSKLERELEVSEYDKELWQLLTDEIREKLGKKLSNIKILDVGTGSGRDIKYATERGMKIIGIDNSEGFIETLEKLQRENIIPQKSFLKADMLSLPFEEKSFDVVRHQASLVHMPFTVRGSMLDKALSENYRVLRDNGLLYVYTKQGKGINYIDTNERLGGRIFQLHSPESMCSAVERNGFKVIKIKGVEEERNASVIHWIVVIAQKV